MNTEQKLKAARDRMTAAQAEVARLESRVEFESSFTSTGSASVVYRRGIDRGDFQGIEAIFTNPKEATRFAEGLAGYGIGKDIFIDSYPLYS